MKEYFMQRIKLCFKNMDITFNMFEKLLTSRLIVAIWQNNIIPLKINRIQFLKLICVLLFQYNFIIIYLIAVLIYSRGQEQFEELMLSLKNYSCLDLFKQYCFSEQNSKYGLQNDNMYDFLFSNS